MDEAKDLEGRLAAARKDLGELRRQVGAVIVGMDETVEGCLLALLAGGHCLLEGVPGLGKTLLVRTLAACLDLRFSRIQFTPDLMPADITGTNLVTERDGRKAFEFQPGPVFAHIVLADEINRATPKTQSALLEAMQEGSVTAGGAQRRLEQPFFVLATQNPIEMEGTYPLPEAQLDRFLFKLRVRFPTAAELREILDRTTGARESAARAVLGGERLLALRRLTREVPVADHVKDYAVRLVAASQPDSAEAPEEIRRLVRVGASPRAAQALLLGAKARALVQGRLNASLEDLRALAPSALRHRLLLSFEGEAEGVDADRVVAALLAGVAPIPEVVPGAKAY